MQAVIGETVKPEEFRVDQIRDISTEVRLGGVARPALIDGCIENRRFLAPCAGAGAGSFNCRFTKRNEGLIARRLVERLGSRLRPIPEVLHHFMERMCKGLQELRRKLPRHGEPGFNK